MRLYPSLVCFVLFAALIVAAAEGAGWKWTGGPGGGGHTVTHVR